MRCYNTIFVICITLANGIIDRHLASSQQDPQPIWITVNPDTSSNSDDPAFAPILPDGVEIVRPGEAHSNDELDKLLAASRNRTASITNWLNDKSSSLLGNSSEYDLQSEINMLLAASKNRTDAITNWLEDQSAALLANYSGDSEVDFELDEAMASTFFVNHSALKFDCRRNLHDCNFDGGLCDMDTGECRCFPGYGGYDCSFWFDNRLNETDCNMGDGCGENGESHCIKDENNSTVCKCAYGYADEECLESPIKLICGELGMAIEVKPPPSFTEFSGLIFVINTTDDSMIEQASCRFRQEASAYRLETSYSNLIEQCGGASVDNTTFATKFVIQNDPHWLTPFDQIFNVKCMTTIKMVYKPSVIVSVEGSASAKGIDEVPVGVSNSLSNLNVEEISGSHGQEVPYETPKLQLTVNKVNYDVQYRNYSVSPVTEPLKIGDPVQITVESVNSTFYTSLQTEDCMIKMDNSISMQLISNACPASKFAWSLLRWDHTVVTNTTMSFWLILPANAMSGQTRFIDIYCRVKVCSEEGRDDCKIDLDGCNNSTNGIVYRTNQQVANYGRRRRSVAELDEFSEFHSNHPYMFTTVHKRFQISSFDNLVNDAAEFASRSSASLPVLLNMHAFYAILVLLLASAF